MTFWERYPIAIDLTDRRECTALQLTEDKQVPVLRATMRGDVQPRSGRSSGAALGCFLKDVVRSPGFKGRSLALLPPLDEVFCYPLVVSVGKDESLEGALVREAGHVLAFPVEEAIIDYTSVRPASGDTAGTHHVQLVAMRKSDMSRYLGVARDAGGVLEIIDTAGAALVRAHSLGTYERSKPAVLCHTGCCTTSLVITSQDSMLAHRDVDWGVDSLRQRLVENLHLDRSGHDVGFLLQEHGMRYAADAEQDARGAQTSANEAISRTVSQILEPQVDGLLHELHSIMGYARSTTPGISFGGVYLYGQAAAIAGLDDYISNELGMVCTSVNPLTKMGLREPGVSDAMRHGSAYALALGLGVRRVQWL